MCLTGIKFLIFKGPTIQHIEDDIFVILDNIMERTINKAIETNSLKVIEILVDLM